MAKKKKQNTLAQQKLAHVQHRNEYMHKLRQVLGVLGDESIFDTFSEQQLELIYKCRMVSPKVVSISKHTIPKSDLEKVANEIKLCLSQRKMLLHEGTDKAISYLDYITYLLPIEFFVTEDKEGIFSLDQKARFIPFMKNYKNWLDKYLCTLNWYAFVLQFSNSNLENRYFYFHTTITYEFQNKSTKPYCVMEINSAEPQVRHLVIDKISCPVIAVEYFSNKTTITQLEIPVSALNIPSYFPNLKLPVYIQTHATRRLRERINPKMDNFIREYFFQSVQDNLIATHDKNGNLLFEFWYAKFKIGYLRADILEGMIVIRTFLFLTHEGTPEAEKLQKLTGLQKEDIKYLRIDNLQTLIDSDILENKKICRLFKESGCGSLLDVCLHIKEKRITWEDPHNTDKYTLNTSFINAYLNKNEQYVKDELSAV